MKQKLPLFLLVGIAILFVKSNVYAQVKIGSSIGAPHPSAVLELEATNKGFLLPSLTNAEMMAIPSPKNGLMIFNNEKNTPYIYKQSPNTWYAVKSDSTEWLYDTTSKKLFLTKALKNRDSIYYDSTTKKMVFGDNNMYNNSTGLPAFPFTDFSGKFYFKSTASRYKDSANSSPITMNIAMEVDSNSNPVLTESGFGALQAIAVANPLATKNIGGLNALSLSTLHSGADTAFAVTGIVNTTTINGKGYAETVTGLNNAVRLSTLFKDTVGTIFGIRNNLTNTTPAPYGEVNGNAYGYYSIINAGFANKVYGGMYGIYLGNIIGSKINKNYAVYTNAGVNRFGDSVIISNVSNTPRAIFDVNTTTSMVIPSGTQVQRPAINLVAGMTRYNIDNSTIEAYNGNTWNGTIRNTQFINVPLINPNAGYTASVAVPNATMGSAVSVSPDVALAGLLSIAWARVSAAGTVEIRFLNGNGTASAAFGSNFNIRVIQ